MITFSPHHINSILVESWDAFKVSSIKVIRDSFVKNKLLPLSPLDLTTTTPRHVLMDPRLNKSTIYHATAFVLLLILCRMATCVVCGVGVTTNKECWQK